MNYMPKVLEMLGVEVEEKFIVKGGHCNPYHFDDEYRLVDSGDDDECSYFLRMILNGEMEIGKIPWKPKEKETYRYIDSFGKIARRYWIYDSGDYYHFNTGNCFRTSEEITDEIKQRILQEMKGKYENE